MKKLLLTICLAATTLVTFAQMNESDDSPITFGIVGGINAAFLQAKLPQGSSVANNTIYPASFGVNFDFRISNYISIRLGLFYSGKGGDLQYVQSTVTPLGNIDEITDQKLELNYLEVPVNIIGHLPLSDNFTILIGTGPYVAKGLSGKNTFTYGSLDPVNQKIKFGKNGDYKSIDFGASSLLGV